MAKFCTECGKEILENVAFCTECGTKIEVEESTAEPQEQQPVTKEVNSTEIKKPVETPLKQPASNAQPVVDPSSKVVSTGAYFGLTFLFAMPVIGFLACIIFAFAPKNKNLKNFAKATLIWFIIGFILMAILVAIGFLFAESFMQYVEQNLGGQLQDIFNQINN